MAKEIGVARPIGSVRHAGWRLGSVAGIELSIDYSWLLIFALVTFSLAQQLASGDVAELGIRVWLAAAAVSVVFFASILLHELGHSLTAQRLGIQVRSITLFLFGGGWGGGGGGGASSPPSPGALATRSSWPWRDPWSA